MNFFKKKNVAKIFAAREEVESSSETPSLFEKITSEVVGIPVQVHATDASSISLSFLGELCSFAALARSRGSSVSVYVSESCARNMKLLGLDGCFNEIIGNE